eukprot:TRINITY_DN4709_c0_g1_i2.p1 TRINITY_DN4709_c0_g1~~TRINITY_DN4709_c0_g1_i2.p1  ORF type:complete len:159 (-),score=17.91 TRINITY_DN4709_c0_g1_i2:335-811(-)
MHLVVVVLCFFFSAYALEDIYDVDIDKLPAIHHKDFRTTLLRPDKRRAVLADESFFLLYGIGSNKGVEHAFVIKPAMQNALQVRCQLCCLLLFTIPNVNNLFSYPHLLCEFSLFLLCLSCSFLIAFTYTFVPHHILVSLLLFVLKRSPTNFSEGGKKW